MQRRTTFRNRSRVLWQGERRSQKEPPLARAGAFGQRNNRTALNYNSKSNINMHEFIVTYISD